MKCTENQDNYTEKERLIQLLTHFSFSYWLKDASALGCLHHVVVGDDADILN
jgi:hypothetical protein